MSAISEAEWKKALTSIVEELNDTQYRKLLDNLDKIPKSQKPFGNYEKLPQIIIEHYGYEESVFAIDEAMNDLPRRDAAIQDKLRPFVKKLKEKEDKNKGKKRKHPDLEEQTAPGGARCVINKPLADQPAMEPKPPSWCQSIRDLLASNDVVTSPIRGRVLSKSKLIIQQKCFFHVLVSDETASIKLVVYGKPHHQKIQEGKHYMFRKFIRDKADKVLVTSRSVVAETGSINIPKEIEKEAWRLWSKSPFHTIEDVKEKRDLKTVSVEGAVTEINPIENVTVKQQKKKVKKQCFNLEDATGSIEVVFVGDRTQQSETLSVGDVIKLIDMNINRRTKPVSLHSTSYTNIVQVHKVGIQNVQITIVGIIKCQKRMTLLEVKLDQNIQTLEVATKLLADAFGISLEKDYKSELVKKLPLLAEATIEGNKIRKILKGLN